MDQCMARLQPNLVIGLVNNMPPAAFGPIEAQFAGLLHEAASLGDVRVELRSFATHAGMQGRAESVDGLWQARLDGLIVTGIQPVGTGITDEPIWPVLTGIVEWASANTRAAIWSCLAAQAAVFHLDGVARRRLPRKLSGVFRCEPATRLGAMQGAPQQWVTPHSRYNVLEIGELERAGYRILSYGPGRDADSFEKQAGHSRFMMLQGHPEYPADMLLREYRRDLKQFVAGAGSAPELPCGYFDRVALPKLVEFHARITERPDPGMLTEFDRIAQTPPAPWHGAAVGLYARWLRQLATQHASARELMMA